MNQYLPRPDFITYCECGHSGNLWHECRFIDYLRLNRFTYGEGKCGQCFCKKFKLAKIIDQNNGIEFSTRKEARDYLRLINERSSQ